MQLSFAPANGSKNAVPSQGITVTAAQGKLSDVTVTTAGEPVTGTLNAAHTAWHSTWTLNVSQTYKVTAKATGTSGQAVTQTSTFTTLTPSQTFTTQIFEGSGATYGVGMPIILYFNRTITNKAAVERALQVKTSTPVTGAWYWDEPCNMAPACLYFRPQSYWPAHTQVTFTGHLDGVEGAPGVYGSHTLTQSFNIGDSLIVVASTATHFMNVYRNGALFAHWPISTGRPGDNTPNGTYLTIDKGNPVLMKGPGYRIKVPWSVRFTWSRRLPARRVLVGGPAGLHEREPRLREHGAGQRGDLLQDGGPRRPGDDHRQPQGRGVGQRLDRLVPAVGEVPQGQRAGPGRPGRADRQHVREPRCAASADRDRAAGRAGPEQLARGVKVLASGGRPPQTPPRPPHNCAR